MGLDMYAMAINKPSEDEVKFLLKEEDCYDLPITCLEERYFKDNKDMYEDLIPYTIKKKLMTKVWDMEKIKKDYPKFDYIVSIHGVDEFDIKLKDDTRIENLSMKHYIKMEERSFYLWHSYDIGYWRKAYPLQEIIEGYLQDRGKELEDCGYYFFSAEEWNNIRKDLEDYFEYKSDEDVSSYKEKWLSEIPNEDAFYHPWW